MNCETCRYSGHGWHEHECSRPTTECSYQPIEQSAAGEHKKKQESENLKPCPFCGSEPALIQSKVLTYRVECQSTFCPCIPSTWFCKTVEGAIKLWNRRANEDE